MKKILVLAMACVLAVLAVGCGSAPDTDWNYISKKGEMIMGITYFEPMNYMKDGKLVGFETEFAEAVCAKLGVKAKFQVIDWNSKETELNSKNIDCIWNGMTITDKRKADMDVTNKYMDNRQVLIVKVENKDKYSKDENLVNAAVVAEESSTGQDVAKSDARFAKSKFTPVDSQAKALMEVKAGNSDIALIDYTMALASTGPETDFADLTIIDKNYESDGYGIAFRKGSPETLAKVNAAIADLTKDGTIAKIAQKYKLTTLLTLK